MDRTRFDRQIAFLKEIDKVKNVFRRTRLLDDSRHENDAEHAWHLAVMAMTLSEHANDGALDISRVIEMVLIHDIVEIDAGDALVYDTALREEKKEKELRAAERIFGMLPEDQRDAFRDLWEEFEARGTSEARFAAALDRLEPIVQNASTRGHAWLENGITRQQAETVNEHISEGSTDIWQYVEELFAEADEKGYFASGADVVAPSVTR